MTLTAYGLDGMKHQACKKNNFSLKNGLWLYSSSISIFVLAQVLGISTRERIRLSRLLKPTIQWIHYTKVKVGSPHGYERGPVGDERQIAMQVTRPLEMPSKRRSSPCPFLRILDSNAHIINARTQPTDLTDLLPLRSSQPLLLGN